MTPVNGQKSLSEWIQQEFVAVFSGTKKWHHISLLSPFTQTDALSQVTPVSGVTPVSMHPEEAYWKNTKTAMPRSQKAGGTKTEVMNVGVIYLWFQSIFSLQLPAVVQEQLTILSTPSPGLKMTYQRKQNQSIRGFWSAAQYQRHKSQCTPHHHTDPPFKTAHARTQSMLPSYKNTSLLKCLQNWPQFCTYALWVTRNEVLSTLPIYFSLPPWKMEKINCCNSFWNIFLKICILI